MTSRELHIENKTLRYKREDDIFFQVYHETSMMESVVHTDRTDHGLHTPQQQSQGVMQLHAN